jgi:N-acetylmuramoyl-L-alanine amidase
MRFHREASGTARGNVPRRRGFKTRPQATAGVTSVADAFTTWGSMHPDRPPRCLPFLLFALLLLGAAGENVFARTSPLAGPVDWSWLGACAGVLTRARFVELLDGTYAPGGAAAGCVEIGDRSVRIRTGDASWTEVAFAPDGADAKKPERFWRKASEMGTASPERPLKGVRIAIDPGHLGGDWAKMEGRFFQMGNTRPVREGDLTLAVAKKLKPQLEKLGAEVQLLRSSSRPVTPDRPKNLRAAAAAELKGSPSPERLQTQSELFFYRVSEIRARAEQVNHRWKPDLVLCLHFNAEEWGEPEHPQLQPRNHLHALVNGCYGAKELELDDIRSEMFAQLFEGTTAEALPLTEAVVGALAEETGLPPFTYFSSNARRVGKTAYVYARNLLANRLYRAPVVFLEPYVMNSGPVWKRVQLGDYSGEKMVDGIPYKSITAEYAAGVVEGLARYYRQARVQQ